MATAPASFGEALRDQLPVINIYTQNGIQFAAEVREFLKERAQIERDYSHKLDQLAKRFLKVKDKVGASLMGDPAGIDGGSETASARKFGTLFKAWETVLTETEAIAQSRINLSDVVIADVADKLKALGARKEEARKKHIVFSQKLLEERSRAYADKDKAKALYDQQCDAVEAAKLRFEKAPDEKSQDKLKKAWHQEIAEMGNAKNNYILSVSVANALKKKFLFTDMPALMDEMQKLNEGRSQATRKLLEDYVTLENRTHSDVQMHWGKMLMDLHDVDPAVDSAVFVNHHKAPWTEPYDFAFEPSLLWKDSDQLVVDEQAKIYLANKLAKLGGKLALVEEQINARVKERDGLQNLIDAYTKNPSTGDADQVNENIIEVMRNMTILQTQKARYETTMQVIASVIGDDTAGKRHDLAKSSFTIPTTCDYCQEKIWGLARLGFTCRTCGYNCHAKCEMKVPPYCSTTTSNTTKPGKTNRVVSSPSAVSSVASSAISPATASNVGGRTRSSTTGSKSAATVSANVIYSYDAMNSDELSIVEGDTVKVITPDDGTGWIRVSSNGKEGLIPASYVEMTTAAAGTTGGGATVVGRVSSLASTHQTVRVIYDYEAQNADELTMREGEIIEVTQQGTDGWWSGKLNGKVGQFPSTYVEPM